MMSMVRLKVSPLMSYTSVMYGLDQDGNSVEVQRIYEGGGISGKASRVFPQAVPSCHYTIKRSAAV